MLLTIYIFTISRPLNQIIGKEQLNINLIDPCLYLFIGFLYELCKNVVNPNLESNHIC